LRHRVCFRRRYDKRSLQIATIRRFWHQQARPTGGLRFAGPLHVAVFYLVFSQTWHLFMLFLSGSMTSDQSTRCDRRQDLPSLAVQTTGGVGRISGCPTLFPSTGAVTVVPTVGRLRQVMRDRTTDEDSLRFSLRKLLAIPLVYAIALPLWHASCLRTRCAITGNGTLIPTHPHGFGLRRSAKISVP
jgi:hypothetical protein